ncbi:MAG: SUMF1/EgtB/PvdO family nonheme iron enzyme [Polyangiaceae bacterium]
MSSARSLGVAALLALVFVGAPSRSAHGGSKSKASVTAKSKSKGSSSKSKTPSKTKRRARTTEDGGASGRKRSKSKSGSARGGAKEQRVSKTRTHDEPRDLSPESYAAAPLSILDTPILCPPDMVAVAGRVCVDRYEISVVDAMSGATWPPYFGLDLEHARATREFYAELQGRAEPTSFDATTPLPPLPPGPIQPRARSIQNVLPQGYLSGDDADHACRAAGKRLCTEAEWVTACRGEEQRAFPYGGQYEQDACNVYRENHPSAMLHGNAARYHDDPRNNLVVAENGPLARKTGETPRCVSRWGDDGIYDMVGNLDEWVDDAGGVFVGGFYSRGSKSGCAARVSTHERGYSDYSLGARCCADPVKAP